MASADESLIDYLTGFCKEIQSLDQSIRFVGMADYGGILIASYYRTGLVPLMDRGETARYALQTVFRARTRGGFKPQIGEQRYAVAVYEKLVRATLMIAHPESERHNLYLLISLDIGRPYPSIFEEKIIPYIAEKKNELFLRTTVLSEKYTE